MPKEEHLHMLKRIRGTKDRYSCIDPDCKYFISKAPQVLSGKRALCPFCRESFVLKPSDFKYATLSCGCMRGKKENDSALLAEKLKEDAVISELLQGVDEI